jgi:hypothetical protein
MPLPEFHIAMDEVEEILAEKRAQDKQDVSDSLLPETIPDGCKQCTVCEKIMKASLENFYHRSQSGDGLDYRCKSCSNSYKKVSQP